MTFRTLGLIATLFLLTACGGGTPASVENLASGAAPSAAPASWDDIRTEHIDALASSDCVSGTGAAAGACNQIRHDSIGALRLDVERLPAGRSKTEMIDALDSWNGKFAGYTESNCAGAGNTGQLECARDESLLNMSIMNIAALARKATN